MTQQATILYIEDDEASRVLIQRVLTYSGYRVLVASRGLEGLDLAKKFRPDLILTDINLPDLSGREITVRLRSDPRLANVPIVAITAQIHSYERDKTFAAGVTGYLTKPIDVSTLISRIEEYLHGYHDPVDAEAMESAQNAYTQELVERLETNVRELEASNRDLRRLDGIKDDFIQLTAHELRTPLTTVYGYSLLVQGSEPVQVLMTQNEEVRMLLDGLITSVERLHSVVNEIITVSRIASGRVDIKSGPTNLAKVMQGIIEDYKSIIEQRNLKIIFDQSEWPSQVQADAALVELALSNLFGNAIKYTPDGREIILKAKVEDEKVQIGIQDKGIGINAEDQKRIFDRFYTAGDTQLHSTSKTAFRGGGLGLGLAICRGIIEAHQGKIWVESEGCDEKELPGSTFFVELPLHVNTANSARQTYL
ncbi:MAG TPA: hybrid sensor histidine kinase/response regulator [Aggregatilineaceae bacterium]|nr:hybrid sensor histidine kinase/response regulator [Aggregatilineaceae bacterium]